MTEDERAALVEELAEKMHECSESKYEPKDRTPWSQLDEFYRKDWRDDADTAIMPAIERLLADRAVPTVQAAAGIAGAGQEGGEGE